MSENKIEEFMVPLFRVELVREKDIKYRSIYHEYAAAEVFHEMLDSSPVEKLAIIHLTHDHRMIGAETVAIGSMDRVSSNMYDIFRGFIKNGAGCCYMAHNHVHGLPQASMPDYTFTLKLAAACQHLDIILIDHLVTVPGSHYSIYKHRAELEEAYKIEDSKRIMANLADSYRRSGLTEDDLKRDLAKMPSDITKYVPKEYKL